MKRGDTCTRGAMDPCASTNVMDHRTRRTEWPFSVRWRSGTRRSTSTYARNKSIGRERRIAEVWGPAAPGPPAHDREPAASLTLATVQRAIDVGQPSLAFQPVVDLQDRRVIGVEALARFLLEPQHPPDAWFDAAHRFDLGVELELSAVRHAVRAAASLPRHLYVAVNVSPQAVLAPGFDATIAEAVAEQLVLEITEHAKVDDYAALAEALA